MIKIPEITAQSAVNQSKRSIVYQDNSIQNISNPNTDQRGSQETIRHIPVNVEVLLAISTLFTGIIIMIL